MIQRITKVTEKTYVSLGLIFIVISLVWFLATDRAGTQSRLDALELSVGRIENKQAYVIKSLQRIERKLGIEPLDEELASKLLSQGDTNERVSVDSVEMDRPQ